MDIILELRKHVKSITPHESLNGMLKNKLNIERKDNFIPENYHFLTHLINPAQTYWSRKYPDIKKSNDVLRKLLLGRKLGKMASYWFRKLPNFFTEEGKLDGAFVGIPRVRGKIDFRIGESIIEFKTKDELSDSENEVLQKYPQDVEQLVFYSVLDVIKSKKNYLVFMNNTRPYKFKAFEVTTIDFGKIKTLLLERIKLLDEALATGDYSKLGQCRYYNEECRYRANDICKCGDMKPLSIETLRKGVTIKYDEKFTQELQKEMEKSDVTKELFTTINIIAPRKYLMERKLKKEDEYFGDVFKDRYITCLLDLIRKLSMKPSLSQWEHIKNRIKEDRLYIAHRWLNIPTSTNKSGEELVPYTVRVDMVDSFEKARTPRGYSLAELSIICGTYGKAKGLIFTVYPNLNDFVQVFEVVFDDIPDILRIIKERLDKLEEAMKTGDIFLVDACPDWMNDGGGCALMKICNSKEGVGCIK